MIKLIFFDVDGTLISNKQKSIAQNVIDNLKVLQDKGIKIVVCTGRHKKEFEDLDIKRIPFDGYCSVNGQICLDNNFNFLWGKPICDEEVDVLTTIFKNKKIPFALKTKNDIYINYINDIFTNVQNSTNGKIFDIKDYNNEEIYAIVAYVNKRQKAVLNDLFDKCNVVEWNKEGVDIINKDCSKVDGIKFFIEYFNVKKEETMAFGDGFNDIDMLKYVQIGIAMGNSAPELKQIADYVTSNCEDDGIVKALKEYKLI